MTLAALVQPREVSLDAALGAAGGDNDKKLTPSPQKKKPPTGHFFILPANATGASHTRFSVCMLLYILPCLPKATIALRSAVSSLHADYQTSTSSS